MSKIKLQTRLDRVFTCPKNFFMFRVFSGRVETLRMEIILLILSCISCCSFGGNGDSDRIEAPSGDPRIPTGISVC